MLEWKSRLVVLLVAAAAAVALFLGNYGWLPATTAGSGSRNLVGGEGCRRLGVKRVRLALPTTASGAAER